MHEIPTASLSDYLLDEHCIQILNQLNNHEDECTDDSDEHLKHKPSFLPQSAEICKLNLLIIVCESET